MIEVTLPIRTYSALNQRIHWAVRAKRVKAERTITHLMLPHNLPLVPVTVTLTRIAPRALDGDNWQGGAKAIRDQIAQRLGVNDNDPRVTWAYAQERFNKKIHLHRYSVRINIAQSAQDARKAT